MQNMRVKYRLKFFSFLKINFRTLKIFRLTLYITYKQPGVCDANLAAFLHCEFCLSVCLSVALPDCPVNGFLSSKYNV